MSSSLIPTGQSYTDPSLNLLQAATGYAPTPTVSDSLPQNAVQTQGTLNPATSTIGKVFDTALDVAGIYLTSKLVGSTYPTGQNSPGQVAAAQAANAQTVNAGAIPTQTLLIGGGVALIGALVLFLALRK